MSRGKPLPVLSISGWPLLAGARLMLAGVSLVARARPRRRGALGSP